MTSPETGRDPLGELLRWETAGGSWHTEEGPAGQVTVVLCRCDGGEEVERLVSSDPALRAYVESRPATPQG